MMKKRVNTARYMCIIILSILCLRLIQIGIIDGRTYETMALNQQNKKQLVKWWRGAIYDRSGVPFTDRNDATLHLDRDGNISAEGKDAVYTFTTKERFSPLASHIIGYTDSDGRGISGAEKLYDTYLKPSSSDYLTYMADASGKPVRDYFLCSERKNDYGIKLTLDMRIQKICEDVMDKYVKKGAAVVLDVESFDVLASVSRPDFDIDIMENYIKSENGELVNRVLMPYNAGSVFKIITSAAAIENSPRNLQRRFNCKGCFLPDKEHRFYCHKSDGHGMISFEEAFAQSCNCAFYAMALDCGAHAIADMAADFGIGSTLLNSPLGESKGNLPLRGKYSPAETLNISIGQGEILITPLQCASMVATVANGGVRKDVNLVSGFVENNIVTDARNKGQFRVISQSTADAISFMMRKCVTDGTGKDAADSFVSIAGKTGSAETGIFENGKMQVHGWFCGFFPAQSPKYALVVFSENGKSGSLCVKPFVEIAEGINNDSE